MPKNINCCIFAFISNFFRHNAEVGLSVVSCLLKDIFLLC